MHQPLSDNLGQERVCLQVHIIAMKLYSAQEQWKTRVCLDRKGCFTQALPSGARWQEATMTGWKSGTAECGHSLAPQSTPSRYTSVHVATDRSSVNAVLNITKVVRKALNWCV